MRDNIMFVEIGKHCLSKLGEGSFLLTRVECLVEGPVPGKKQVAKVMVSTARIAAEHGSFDRKLICQMVPLFIPFNTRFICPSPKRHLDWFSRSCSVHRHTDRPRYMLTVRHLYQ